MTGCIDNAAKSNKFIGKILSLHTREKQDIFMKPIVVALCP